MGGTIEVVNDVRPWLAARTFTGADTDLGLLRHVLTVPPDCGSMRLFAAHQTNTWGAAGVKTHVYDDCWEIVVCPLGGVRPNPGGQDGVVAAWLWGSGFDVSEPWADVDSLGFPRVAPVLEVSGPMSGWNVFARPGFLAQSTPADVVVTLHLRAVVSGMIDNPGQARIDQRCTLPPCVWDAGLVARFPSPVSQRAYGERQFVSKEHVVTVPAGQSRWLNISGGPWKMEMVRNGAVAVSDQIHEGLAGGTVSAGFTIGAATSGVRWSSLNLNPAYPEYLMQNPLYRLDNATLGPSDQTLYFRVRSW